MLLTSFTTRVFPTVSEYNQTVFPNCFKTAPLFAENVLSGFIDNGQLSLVTPDKLEFSPLLKKLFKFSISKDVTALSEYKTEFHFVRSFDFLLIVSPIKLNVNSFTPSPNLIVVISVFAIFKSLLL